MIETQTQIDVQEDVDALQRLLLQVSYASQRLMARRLDEYNLTLAQYMALKALGGRSPHSAPTESAVEGLSMSALAERCLQVSATMTGIVDRLSERGLLERKRDPNDRRALRVALTPSGSQMLDAIDQANRRRLQIALGRMKVDERAQMLKSLQAYLQVTIEEMEQI
jgi:DNA-binding MarR family transcriptional regulator